MSAAANIDYRRQRGPDHPRPGPGPCHRPGRHHRPRRGRAPWADLNAISDDLLAKYRIPGAFGPRVVVFGPEVPVTADAPLKTASWAGPAETPSGAARALTSIPPTL